MKGYELTAAYWDQVFEKMRPYDPTEPFRQEELNAALDWLGSHGDTVVDFGCGTGHALLRLAHQGARRVVGIDISQEAVQLASATAFAYGLQERAFFLSGGLRCLHEMEPASFKGAILFNILDNMRIEDATDLVKQIHRILEFRGRVLLKLNAWAPAEVIEDNPEYTRIGEDFYQDSSGLFFWNISSTGLEELITPYFLIEEVKQVVFPHYETENRLFYLRAM